MKYIDLDERKTAFIFELDNVIYPEKDYLFQIYYLFAASMEYVELIDAKAATDFMVNTYFSDGKDAVFGALQQKFNIADKYRDNFQQMMHNVKLPLKLLVYTDILELMQQIVIDRKRIFIVTNGHRDQQLNKIKQTEWNGLESYLTCYFADEVKPKPETDVIDKLIQEQNLKRKDLLMIGDSETDELCAQNAGLDYLAVNQFL
jgi:HAD superfamily hydrolase (TIGR01549 family)